MLQNPTLGELICELRKKIQEIKSELVDLGDPDPDIPELITSTNLLRANEYLSKTNQKKTELLSVYQEYSKALETMLSSVFEIQNELKEILKDQSSLIASQTKKQTRKTTKSVKTKK